MKKLLFAAIILSGFGGALSSQNLVPNHDFDQVNTCPIAPEDSNPFISWFNPPLRSASATSLHFHAYHSCRPNGQFGLRHKRNGNCILFTIYHPYPKEGAGYAALHLLDTILDNRRWYIEIPPCSGNYNLRTNHFLYDPGRSFAEVQLQGPLTANQIYIIEYYVLHNSSPPLYHSQNLGAFVTTDTFYHQDYRHGNIQPTVEPSGMIVEDTDWVRVKGSFIATGNERFLTLGNFRTDAQSTYQLAPADTNRGNAIAPQYFIDAVYLYKATDTVFSVHLPPDTLLCPGDSLRLHAAHDDGFKLKDTTKTFLWNTGSTDSSITVKQPGTYWVKVEYNHRFPAYDTIEVNYRQVYQSGLPDTVEGCAEEGARLAANDPGRQDLQVQWSTGDTGYSIEAGDSAWYVFTAMSPCDTTVDSVLVALDSCRQKHEEPEVYIPNTFTPNNDGLNDTWEIANLPEDNELTVFNRWGILLYKEKGYSGTWDGTDLSGERLRPGVYVYKLTYRYYPGITKEEKGWVQILRR